MTTEYAFESDTDPSLPADHARMVRRITESQLTNRPLTPFDLAQVEEIHARLEESARAEEETIAGLKRQAAAMRPGETFKEFVEWGQAQGFTTLGEIQEARLLEGRPVEATAT